MPYVNVKVNSVNVKALIDSGCSRSIVSSSLVSRLGVDTVSCSERITLMDGSNSESKKHCTVLVNFLGKVLGLDCLVSNLLFDFEILLGMDAICSSGGISINKNGYVSLEQCCTASSSLFIDDPDFTADFVDGHWLAKWKWRDGVEPRLKNSVAQYKVGSQYLGRYEAEVEEWIKKGWLESYSEDHNGIIPLMAVVQINKDKVRPVMDYRELNCYVSSHTAESDVCHEKLRKWRKLGSNLQLVDLRKAYLQIRIDPTLFKYQVVRYKDRKYCLTRLGFGLNCAPKIMSSILRKVFSLDPSIEKGTDSYIDDIIVNNDIVSTKCVMDHLKRYGLETKEPESIDDARVLGLKVGRNTTGVLMWKRDNVIDGPSDVRTRRQIFSLCGKLTGHFPVAGWLRPACSYIKRLASNVEWDSVVDERCIGMAIEIQERVKKADPVCGVWAVDKEKEATIYCDASSLAIGVVVMVDGRIVEDASWLRKKDDPLHINAAELESIIKGLNLAVSWGFQSVKMVTDSSCVYGWLKCIADKERPIKTTGLSSLLVKRRISILSDLLSEFNVNVSFHLVKSQDNKADPLTRVPEKWLRQETPAAVAQSTNVVSLITNQHNQHHFGIDKTLFFCQKLHPEHNITREMVSAVVSKCHRCKSFDPAPTVVNGGEVSVQANWYRLACDVTHYGNRRFFTLVDCGPSRYAIWQEVINESAVTLQSVVENVFRSFGPPIELLMDNHKSFRCADFLSMLRKWNVNPWFRCAHKASGNAIVERNHRTIKCMAARSGGNILDMVFYYNAAPKNLNGKSISPFNQLFRHEWRPKAHFNGQIAKSSSFKVGDRVFVKPPSGRCTVQWSTGTVTQINSPWNIEVDGMPRHTQDLRLIPQHQGGSLSGSHHLPTGVEVTQRDGNDSRPQRDRRLPEKMKDYVLY